MKTLIIQTSPHHTASTFLINALYGLIPELCNKKIIGDWTNNFEKYFDEIILVKCHNIDIDELILKYNNKYKLYFICSERSELNYMIDLKYKSYDNVIVFDFIELNETETYDVPKILVHIADKIKPILSIQLNIELNIENGINRIVKMNNLYEKIKNLPFNYIDNFFEIHGSHRNRKKR